MMRCCVAIALGGHGLLPASALSGVTERVSVSSSGEAGSGFNDSQSPSVSGDGRYVAFLSGAPNLHPDGNDRYNVYVRDRVARTTSRVSPAGSVAMGQAANLDANNPSISANGRFVAFELLRRDPLTPNEWDREIRVSDRLGGSELIDSDSSTSNRGLHLSFDAISGDGRYVVYGRDDLIVVYDRTTGSREFVNSPPGVATSGVISDDGKVVAFSHGSPLAATAYRSVLATGLTEVISRSLLGQPVPGSAESINGDGSVVTLASRSALSHEDTNGAYDVYVYDGSSNSVAWASRPPSGQPNGASFFSHVSANGRFVAFHSAASNLITGDTNGDRDVFVVDRRTGVIERASVTGSGQQIALGGTSASISGDGKVVAFQTTSEEMGDCCGLQVYVREPSYLGPLPGAQTIGGGPSSALDSNPCLQRRTNKPVNTATGAESLTVTDVALPAAGIAFEFTRSYTSLDSTVSALGRGWTHPFLASLSVTATDVTVTGENGQRAQYVKLADGSFAPPPGVRARLVQTAAGYTLSTRAHRVSTFEPTGRLVGVTLRGQGLALAYDTFGRLATVTDSAGRVVTFAYTPDGSRVAQVTLPDGRYVAYGYDATNRLRTVRDLRGGITTYTYDAGDRLASQTDPNGRIVFRNTYDQATGRVVTQLDAKGNQTLFAWDPATETSTVTDPRGGVSRDVYSGNVLIKRIDPLGRTTTYGYDERANCTSTTDGRGNTTLKEYDPRGNLTKVTSPAPVSAVESFSYDAKDNMTAMTDERGKTTTFEYDAQDRLIRSVDPAMKVTTYTYNARSQVETVTDVRGKLTRYGYDSAGNLTSVTSPLGKVTTMGFDSSGRMVWRTDPRGNAQGADPLRYRTRFTYNDADLPLTVTNPLNHATSFEYDAVGNRTKVTDARGKITLFAYDELDRPVSQTDPRGGVTATGYDENGNVVSETTPTGSRTTFAYDLANQVTGMTMPRGNVSGATAETYTWHYEYDAAGNRTKVIDPADKETVTTYDNLNRPTRATDPLGHAKETVYDNAGNVTAQKDALGNTATFAYDDLGRLSSVTSPRGNAAGATPSDFRTVFAYDAAGNRTEVVAPRGGKTTWGYNDDGRMTAQVDPRGYVLPNTPAAFTTSYAYDDAGNLTRVTDPLGNQTNFAFDEVGRQTSVTDARGKITRYGYDQGNRLVSVTGPAALACTTGPDCVAGRRSTVHTYDDNGNLTSKLSPLNYATNYQYNLDGRVTRKTTPTAHYMTYTYDADGNPAVTTPGRGNLGGTSASKKITYTHDAVGRLTRTDYGDATPDVSFTYDDAGRRTTMSDGAGTVTYTYDNADRIAAVNRAGGDSWAYGYDPDGAITSRTYPDQTVIDATFDRDGNLTAVTQGTTTTNFAYDPAGRLTTTTLPAGNGHIETRAYDNAGRLTQVKNAKGPSVLSQFTRTLDPVGNPTTIATLRGTSTTYETLIYDAANRLSEWCQHSSPTCAASQRSMYITYDGAGRRKSMNRLGFGTQNTSTSFSYNPGDQLTTVQTRLFGTSTVLNTTTNTYDADGNQTANGARTFAYDLAGRMTSTTQAGISTNYTYDGDGERLTRATGTTVDTRYSWDKLNPLPELALERDVAGNLIRRYTQGPTGPISMTTNAGDVYYHHRDGLGSITDLTNSAGAAQIKTEYEPFGTTLTTTKINPAAPANPVGFTGEHQDTETGDYHLRARQYDPVTGHFRATDPVTPALTDQYVSPYTYVSNRPGVLTDPSGLIPVPPIFGQVGDVIGAVGNAGVQILGGGKDAVVGTWNAVTNPIDTTRALIDLCRNGLRTVSDPTGCISGAVARPTAESLVDMLQSLACGDTNAFWRGVGGLGVSVLGGKGIGAGANKLRGAVTTVVDPGKFDYLFGRVTPDPHNTPRSVGNAAQMARLGVPDTPAGHALLRAHFDTVASTPASVARSFTTEHGTFQIRESLFAGPSGAFAKFQTTWQVLPDNSLRLVTVIAMGG